MENFGWLHIILILISLIIIFLTLIQESKSDGASGALMGGGLNLFSETKERGLVKIISNSTFYFIFAYIFISLFIKVL